MLRQATGHVGIDAEDERFPADDTGREGGDSGEEVEHPLEEAAADHKPRCPPRQRENGVDRGNR